jgi:hypothetical protein
MSSTNIVVENKDIIKTYTANNVDIRVINFNLGKSVTVNAVTKQGDNIIDIQTYDIIGQEYYDWGQDDSYLENLVLSKLGLVKKQ